MDTENEYEYNSEYEQEDVSYEQGEPMSNREQVMKDLFNTEERISLMRHSWRGDVLKPFTVEGVTKYRWVNEPERALAGDRFINKQMAFLRAICNPTNAISKKSYDECRVILHDAVDTFIRDLVNEENINRKEYRTMSKSFEAALELFLGLVEAGHGAKVLNDALAGINTQNVKEEKKTGWFNR